MKKKHLRSLNTIEKWLNSSDSDLKDAFQKINAAIDNRVEDSSEESEASVLPVPAEIAHTPGSFALYSDGGCRGNPGPGAFAFVIQEYNGTIFSEGVEFDAFTTNNKMELSGPLVGLKKMKELLPEAGHDPLLTTVTVITDSKYVVDGMKSWVQGWKARGWKKADNKVPENLELWQELDSVRNQFLKVEWMWVKGHGGHPQNEYCDKKANEIMDEKKV